jgi:hypothetical protein
VGGGGGGVWRLSTAYQESQGVNEANPRQIKSNMNVVEKMDEA